MLILKRLEAAFIKRCLILPWVQLHSNAGGAPSATIVLNTTIFDAAVKSSLICRAKVTNCFEGMASAEGWVYDENQTLIAKSQADFKLLKRS